MTLPLPDWIPWWAQLAIIVVGVLFGLAILLMPFAVFGLRGRRDFIEAQLDDVHAEIRMLAMRLPEADRRVTRPVDPEPAAAAGGRGADDWTSQPPSYGDPEPILRRPLRAAPAREPERGRAEPTLRRPTP